MAERTCAAGHGPGGIENLLYGLGPRGGTHTAFYGEPLKPESQAAVRKALATVVEERLDNTECKRALAALRSRVGQHRAQAFENQVRVMLGVFVIRRQVRAALPRRDRSTEQLERRLRTVRGWIRNLERKPACITRSIPFDVAPLDLQTLLEPDAPLPALRQYESDLIACLAAWKRISPKRNPRHTKDPDTESICDFVSFVRWKTSESCWQPLATLLRHVTGDHGWTAHRLHARCTYAK